MGLVILILGMVIGGMVFSWLLKFSQSKHGGTKPFWIAEIKAVAVYFIISTTTILLFLWPLVLQVANAFIQDVGQ